MDTSKQEPDCKYVVTISRSRGKYYVEFSSQYIVVCLTMDDALEQIKQTLEPPRRLSEVV